MEFIVTIFLIVIGLGVGIYFLHVYIGFEKLSSKSSLRPPRPPESGGMHN